MVVLCFVVLWLSCLALSCLVVVLSCLVVALSFGVLCCGSLVIWLSCLVVVLSCGFPVLRFSWIVLSLPYGCVVLCCLFFIFSYFFLSYRIVLCRAVWCLVMPCLFFSCLASPFLVLSCLVLSCLVLSPYLPWYRNEEAEFTILFKSPEGSSVKAPCKIGFEETGSNRRPVTSWTRGSPPHSLRLPSSSNLWTRRFAHDIPCVSFT